MNKNVLAYSCRRRIADSPLTIFFTQSVIVDPISTLEAQLGIIYFCFNITSKDANPLGTLLRERKVAGRTENALCGVLVHTVLRTI